MKPIADLILDNGRITTLDPRHPEVNEVVIVGDKFAGVDNAAEFERGRQTKVIDLKGRRVIPGLYDSHLHVIRGGLNYNMELRWDGVPSLADAMRMLRDQAARTPAPQWVRVVGGFTDRQFAEKRLPTIDELNAVAPQTAPHLLLAARALRQVPERDVDRRKLCPLPGRALSRLRPGRALRRLQRGPPPAALALPRLRRARSKRHLRCQTRPRGRT